VGYLDDVNPVPTRGDFIVGRRMYRLPPKGRSFERKVRKVRKVRKPIILTAALVLGLAFVTPQAIATPGVRLVKDISPGPAGSAIGWTTEVGGTLFFDADDGAHGYELWKSDGTEAGTAMVKDIRSGSESSSPFHLCPLPDGTLYFVADDGTHGQELWKTDGTEAGTTMLKDINPGPDGSRLGPLVDVGGTLFFSADYSLWKSDGTEAGTVLVDSLPWVPWALTDVEGTLYFSAIDDPHGRELWKSDGTEVGTVMVKDINPGGGPSFPGYLTDVGGTLYFEASRSSSPSRSFALWKSDGTGAGTVMVKGIDPSPGLTDLSGTLYFKAYDDTHGYEL
jgi:ELWxxDGT repeat protein